MALPEPFGGLGVELDRGRVVVERVAAPTDHRTAPYVTVEEVRAKSEPEALVRVGV